MPLGLRPLSSGGLSSDVLSSFTYAADGGLVLGGSSNTNLTIIGNASGLLSLGGTNTVQPTYLYNASGLLSLGLCTGRKNALRRRR
jgi:hypothetical protein